MPEVKEYAVLFKKGDSVTGGFQWRQIEAFDAADVLVQANVLIREDSRIGHQGELYEYRVARIDPVKPMSFST